MARRKITQPRRARLVYVPQLASSASTRIHKVASIDDVFKLVLQSIQGENISESSLFDGRFNFSIRICGDQWSGDVDYRVASFILRAQKEILAIYNKYSNTKIKINTLHKYNKDLILKLRIEDGSTKAMIYVERCLKHIAKMVDGMESKHKRDVLIALSSIGLFTACIGVGSWKYFDTQLKISEAQYQSQIEISKIRSQKDEKVEDEKTKRLFAEVIQDSMKNTGALVSSVEYLAKQMRGNDTMHIGGETYTQPEAVAAFKQTPSVDVDVPEKTCIVDGKYDITDVSLENGSIDIKNDGKKRKVITRFLPEEQKDHLHRLYRDCEIVNTYPRNVELQINLIVKDGHWVEAHVYGLGAARPGTISITDALKLSIPKKKPKQEQASLLVE